MFDVAVEKGYISADPNQLGTFEKKWNVKIVCRTALDYDALVTGLSSKVMDGVIIVDFDTLPISTGRALLRLAF